VKEGLHQNDLVRIAKRLDHLETVLVNHSDHSLVERPRLQEVTFTQNVPMAKSTEQYQERLALLEETIQSLQHQLDVVFQSISPVADLGSPEAELIRANRYYHELDEPSTAVQAYASLLERYELTYDEILAALTNSAESFDSAAQKRSSFVAGNASLLSLLEDRISQLQKEDQGVLFSMLANGCMHGECYEDAYRLYQKAIQTLPDDKHKVSAYWSMSFAARHAVGEDAFFGTLSQGHKLGSDLGVDVSSFEKEISNPREMK
jgi:tetratricopeptide (TPR) repeat protein